MFRFRFSAALLSGLALTACSKNNETAPDGAPRCAEYVAGDVAIGMQPATEAAQVFALANAQGLVIDHLSGFSYVSGLPADSLAYVKRVLRSKPYLNTRGFSGDYAFVYTDRKIHVANSQFDLNAANQADWLQTLQTLQLADERGARCDGCKTGFLKVPAGSEQRWVTELAKNPLLRWAELNCKNQIVLH